MTNKPTKERPLTIKQQRFIDFYDGNATEAALKAGYSKKTAPFIGAENLKKPKIAQAIQNREQKRNGKHIATREERQLFWTEGMNDVTLDIKDRHKASELLGRSEADFTDNKRLVDKDGEDLEWKVEIVEVKK